MKLKALKSCVLVFAALAFAAPSALAENPGGGGGCAEVPEESYVSGTLEPYPDLAATMADAIEDYIMELITQRTCTAIESNLLAVAEERG